MPEWLEADLQPGVSVMEVDDRAGDLYMTPNTPVAPLSTADPVSCLKYNLFGINGTCAVGELEGEDYVMMVQAVRHSRNDAVVESLLMPAPL